MMRMRITSIVSRKIWMLKFGADYKQFKGKHVENP